MIRDIVFGLMWIYGESAQCFDKEMGKRRRGRRREKTTEKMSISSSFFTVLTDAWLIQRQMHRSRQHDVDRRSFLLCKQTEGNENVYTTITIRHSVSLLHADI